MTLLIDTCTLIWLATGSATLPGRVRRALASDDVAVSKVSRIEIVMKEAKYGAFDVDFDAVIARAGFANCAFPAGAHRAYAKLPFHHCDPFDRMLIAHALQADLGLVTSDANVRKYDVPVFW